MHEVTAFAPGHITGLFQICDQSVDLLLKGSRGAGVSIINGVTTKVALNKSSKSSYKIRINSYATKSARVSEHVINTFLSYTGADYEILVDHEVELPLGCGFGMSGAGALSLALALNEVFNLGLSRIEAAQIAHIAEVECKTGLGTVIAETFGGLEIRTKPGAPGVGEVKNISVSNDYVVACLSFGSIFTKKILTNEKFRQRIEFGGELVDKLVAQPEPTFFMRLSRDFAEYVGLISPRIRKVLRETDSKDLICSMAMFGESVFSLVKKSELQELLKIFRKHTPSEHGIIVAAIDFGGARLLD